MLALLVQREQAGQTEDRQEQYIKIVSARQAKVEWGRPKWEECLFEVR
jgi:hypothetical protein